MSYYIVHNNSKSLKHAAPYSTPNDRKRLLARWTVKNLKVFQETPGNANSGIFASFDLVNANNPKEKPHSMQFSFADGTSADKNIIARIRRFFNDAYNRQRGYGFPELTEMEKQQIVARINTAYNQWSGFSHSADEPDVIDCASNQDDYLEHHGVKGQKWGVINNKPTDPRQRARSSSGHPYYSPNTGNASNTTNSVVKRDTNPGKNTSISTKKTHYTADLSQKPLSDTYGVHYCIGMGNSGYGAQITIPANSITSTLDRNEDLAALVKNHVIQGINDFRTNPHYGEPYKHLYLTDKQIDSVVWRLVYTIEKNWKKYYYKPGQY